MQDEDQKDSGVLRHNMMIDEEQQKDPGVLRHNKMKRSRKIRAS